VLQGRHQLTPVVKVVKLAVHFFSVRQARIGVLAPLALGGEQYAHQEASDLDQQAGARQSGCDLD